MNKETSKQTGRQEIIERYCPGRGENVIMIKISGEHTHLRCINYQDCKLDKNRYCERDGK